MTLPGARARARPPSPRPPHPPARACTLQDSGGDDEDGGVSAGWQCQIQTDASLAALYDDDVTFVEPASEWKDLPLELVPDDKKWQQPFGGGGLIEHVGMWANEGCEYPFYAYWPETPLCPECSSVASQTDALMWKGPCVNNDEHDDWEEGMMSSDFYANVAWPENFPTCSCDCAAMLREIETYCADGDCTALEVYGADASCNCADPTSTSYNDECADEFACDGDALYDDEYEFGSLWGADDCIKSDGSGLVVDPADGDVCYDPLASSNDPWPTPAPTVSAAPTACPPPLTTAAPTDSYSDDEDTWHEDTR